MNHRLFNFIPDGISFVKTNCPLLYDMLLESTVLKKRVDSLKSTGLQSGESVGFQDLIDIQDISLDVENCKFSVKSVAGFKERKGVITIVSEVFDSATGESIKGAAVTVKDAYSLNCDIESYLYDDNRLKNLHFFVRSSFYWTETDEHGKPFLKTYEVRRDSGVVYNECTDIVKNIMVSFPNTIKPRDYTIILYNRTAEAHVEDPDKVYPDISAKDNVLPFYLPFTGGVQLAQGRIKGVDKDESVIRLQHPVKKTEVTFNKDKDQNWLDIKWSYLNNKSVLQWNFPENWRNNLSLEDLSVNAVFDFYARLVLLVTLDGSDEPIPIPITIGSNIEEDSTHCKIKQIFLQWGCLSEKTQILMANGMFKKVCEIKIGDKVNIGKNLVKVSDIYTGKESDILHIITKKGKHLLLTASHPVLTDRGWIRAGDLSAADKIVTLDGSFEKLEGLYTMPYNRKVYSLKLENNDMQLVAEGLIVGDFMRQNQMDICKSEQDMPIRGQEKIASEFQILVDEINRQHNWK